MNKLKYYLVIIIPIFCLFVSSAKANFPDFPMTFYGTANYNNLPILVGSKIRAISDGLTIGETEIKTSGIYGSSSPIGPNLSVSKFTGNSINFYYISPGTSEPLQNVSPISSTTSFISGAAKELNFNFILNSSNGGGGGGGGNITYCSNITYTAWNTCSNNQQFRSVTVKTPSDCVLTTAQQISLQQNCDSDETTVLPINTSENPIVKPITSSSNIISGILNEAAIVHSNNPSDLISVLGTKQDASKELNAELKYKKILNSDKSLDTEEVDAINRFIVYGTQITQILGEGERAGVINSYFQAYGKLLDSEEEWADALKIANGRWPSERNSKAESTAKNEFKKIYGRDANVKNNIDENAVMVISYGLLPSQRNLNSEKAAIKAFKWAYNRVPVNALDWSIVRSIAYSGAKR